MKAINEEEIVEYIEWTCPYKKCQYVNVDENMFGYPDTIQCQHCGKTVKVNK